MRDIDNLQNRMAHEEKTLAATHEQIEAARANIETLRKKISDTQRQIETTEAHITKLQEHTTTIEKRIALLREYMEMVESGGEPPVPLQSEPVVSEAAADVEALVDDMDLDFVQPLPTAAPTDTSTSTQDLDGPASFETIEEETLTDEVLPRTQTFREELLLVLAYHRKALAAKDVARVFRRLDYAPKLSPTSKNVKTQVETDHHLFEYATGDKIALTREGRTEAQRLLELLL
jgi:hypothetical protein